MFFFVVLCYENHFIKAYFCTQMAGLHSTCSAFSPVLLRCQLVFISHWVQTDGFIAKVCKQLILCLSPQGLVKPDYSVIWRSMRLLEFMNHSNQIWKQSYSPLPKNILLRIQFMVIALPQCQFDCNSVKKLLTQSLCEESYVGKHSSVQTFYYQTEQTFP